MIIALIKTIFYGLICIIIATPIIVILGMLGGLPPAFSFIFGIFVQFIAFYYCYLEFKKEEDAKRKIYLITKKISKEPNNLELYIQRASNFNELKRYGEAIQDCNYVLRRNVRNLDAYCILIDSYILSQDYDSAIKNCYKALDINQTYYEIYKKMKTAKCEKRDYKSAIEDLKIFISLGNLSDKSSAYREIGYIYYYNLNDPENAILNYTKSIELNPKNIQSFYYRAICFHLINKLNSAKKDFAMVIDMYEQNNSDNLDNFTYHSYENCKNRLNQINDSIKLSKHENKIDNTDFDVEAIYNYRYESDFIYWCEKTGYEPDNAGSYDAWLEEKNSDFINDDE